MDVYSIGSIEVQWQLRLRLQIKILLSFSRHHSLIAVYPHGSSCTDGEIFSTPRNSVVITRNLVTWWPSCLVESHENKELCTVRGTKGAIPHPKRVLLSGNWRHMACGSYQPCSSEHAHRTNEPTLNSANATPCRSWHQMLSKYWAFQFLKWYVGVDGSCEQEEIRWC